MVEIKSGNPITSAYSRIQEIEKKNTGVPKGGFFSESAMCFLNLQISKKILQKTILSLKFKFPTNNTLLLLAGNLNFKFRIAFRNIFFWRYGDLKNKSHFLKKATFSSSQK